MSRLSFFLSLVTGFLVCLSPVKADEWEVTEAKVEDGYYRICNDRHGDGAANNGEGVVVVGEMSGTYAGHKALIMKDRSLIATGDKDWASVWHIWSDGKGNYHVKNCGTQPETYAYPMYTCAGQSDYIFCLGKEREDLSMVRFYTKDWGSTKSNDRNSAMDRQDTSRDGYVFIRPVCSLWRWRIGGSALVKLNSKSGLNPQAEWKLEPVDVTGYEDWLALTELITDVDGSNYTVGENPGNVGSSVVMKTLEGVLETARALADNGGTESEYKDMLVKLKAAKAEVDKNIVPLTEGYYIFKNRINKTALTPYNDFATRPKSVATSLDQSSTVSRKASPGWLYQAWFLGWDNCSADAEDADQQFVWRLAKASDSTFYMKNCAESSYIKDSVYFEPLLHSKSKSEDAMGIIPMHGTARVGVEFKNLVGNTYELYADNNWFHFSHGDNHLVNTTPTYTTVFASWNVCKVPESRITAKFKLNDAITDAGGILVDWIPGNNPGQLKMSIAQPLMDALAQARQVYANEAATDADYTAAEADLRKVFDTTKELLKDTASAQNALVDGFYYIVSAEPKFQQVGGSENIPYCYGGSDDQMHWSVDKSLRGNLDHVFQIKKLESGNYSVQCVGTGQYIGGSNQTEILPMTNELELEQIFTLHPTYYYPTGSYKYWLDMYSTCGWWSISSTQQAHLPYQLKSWDNGKGKEGLMQPFNWPGGLYYNVIAVTDPEVLGRVEEVLKEKILLARLSTAIDDADASMVSVVSYDVKTDEPLIYEADDADMAHNQFDSNAQQIGDASSRYANLIDGNKTTYWISRTGTSYGPYMTEHPYLQVDLRDKPQKSIRFKYGVYGNTKELYGPLGERPITYGVTDNGQRRRPTTMKVYATNDTTSTWTLVNTYTLITDPNIREFYSPAIVMDKEYRFVRFYCYDNYAHAVNRGWGVMQPGEFQVYPAVYNAANSMVEYDADVKAAAGTVTSLNEEARKQLAAQKTTEDFVNKYEEAISTLKAAIIDTMPLVSRIYEAKALYDSSYVDNREVLYGDVTAEQKAELAAAIKAAEVAADINARPTKTSLAAAYEKLDAAYKKLSGERKTFEIGKWYYIVSTAKQGYHVESNPEWRGNHAVYASGNNTQKPFTIGKTAPEVEPLRWGHYTGFNGMQEGQTYPKNLGENTDYTGGNLSCEANPYAQWRIVQIEDSLYAIQNRATGFYMGRIQDYITNTGKNGITLSASPMKVRINLVGRNQFEIIPDDTANTYYRSTEDAEKDVRDSGNGLPLHSCAADFRMQWWGTGTERGYNTASSYTFVPVEDETADVEYPAYDDNIQIMTLPFAVDFTGGVVTSLSSAQSYAVKNVLVDRTAGTTQVELVNKEKFEAGEPFVLLTGKPSDNALPGDSLQVCVTPGTEYTAQGKVANGLVGMLDGDSIQAPNMGVFEKGVLQVMPDCNVFVNGQTGYLNPALVKDLGGTANYTVTGKGVIDAINSVVVEKNAAANGVYSIDGKLVSKDSAKGLSKGVYIIGKKKVLVK